MLFTMWSTRGPGCNMLLRTACLFLPCIILVIVAPALRLVGFSSRHSFHWYFLNDCQ